MCYLNQVLLFLQGGIYIVQLLDTYGAPIAIIFVVFLEAVAVSWIYGNFHYTIIYLVYYLYIQAESASYC